MVSVLLMSRFTVEKCKYCGKTTRIREKGRKWICPDCGKKNERRLGPCFLA